MMPIVAGISAPVTTANTPGYPSARLVSIETTRACGCGLRRSRPHAMRGSLMSPAYFVWPDAFWYASIFGFRFPITENWVSCSRVTTAMPGLLAADGALELDVAARLQHGIDDLRVT